MLTNPTVPKPELPRYWLFLISVLVLFILIWSSFLLVRHPESGITWSFVNGLVIEVSENSPAHGLVQKGDRIIAVDGVPVYDARDHPGKRVGDKVVLTVESSSGEGAKAVPIILTTPPAGKIILRLSIIPIALAFWLLGTIVLAYGQVERLSTLFYFLCQMVALILGLGSTSAIGPEWNYISFGVLLWWIGPLTLHTHLAFSSQKFTRFIQILIGLLYGLAFLLSLADVKRMLLMVTGPLLTLKFLMMGVLLFTSTVVLLANSIWDASAENRRKTRIAGISAVVAMMPMIFLSLLPDALTGQFYLPYEITLLALLLLPAGYTYSILQFRLVKIEREINQSAAYALAAFIIFILYTFIYIFVSSLFSFETRSSPLLVIAIVFVLVITARQAHQTVYRRLYKAIYGGWVDDHGAVKRISQDLKHVTGDTFSIAQTLCQTLQKTLMLDYVHLLLSDGRLIKTAKENQLSSEVFITESKQAGSLFARLQEQMGRESGPAEELHEFLVSSGKDAASLLGPQARLWLLFGGQRTWQGLLVLGSKRDRSSFESKDLEILEVVLRQAGAALENERLLEEVRQRASQIRELNRKGRWTLEVERKRIARDLHDIVIQNLIGINFQLANVRARNDPETAGELEAIRSDLHESLVELRGICADLRPPALDALGLSPAIEARITEIKSQVGFEVVLNSAELNAYEIPDDVALCIYRFMQETLMNVQKHSTASKVRIALQVEQDTLLRCIVEDDGQGFQVPESLEVLVGQQHFGLIGLQEQVEAVGGRMLIESQPGSGCRLTALVPLKHSIESALPDL